MNKLLALATGLILAFGCSATALAQNAAAGEIGIAHAHALMAQNADSVKMAHAHLQHVTNCLVSPDNTAYDASAGTPCKGHGNGAIPDSAGNATLHKKLASALASAQAGLQADKLSAVQADAAQAANALDVTSAGQSSGGSDW